MTSLRRFLAGSALIVAGAAIALLLFALLLPGDGTKRILERRGQYGGAEELAARDDARSSIRHLAFRNHRGETVASAWLRRPLALDPDYRIVITYAGAKTGEAILDLIPSRDDLVVVAVQYPYEPRTGLLSRLRAVYDIRHAAYGTVAGGLLAVDHLEHSMQLDPARTILLGASLGSIFATLHGAIDGRVPDVVLVHGGAGLPATLEGAIAGRTPAWLRPGLVRLARIPTDTFDPARYVARIAPRRLVVIAARDDRHFPPEAVRAFFERAGEPKELRWTETSHVGVRKGEIVEVVLEELTGYLGPDRKNLTNQ